MRAGLGGDRPGKAPAVAVEHRQRPEIDRMKLHLPGHRVPGRVQPGAAMVIDHALGIAGRARGVVQRDRIPLVRRRRIGAIRIALRQQRFVVEAADPVSRSVIFRVVDIDRQDLPPEFSQRLSDGVGEFPVDEYRLRLAMLEHEGDGRGIEADVQRVQHGARHRHAEMALQHFRRVGGHNGHGIALADAPPGNGVRQPVAAPARFAPGKAAPAMHDRRTVRENPGCALQKGKRRQRLVICRLPVEPPVIGAHVRTSIPRAPDACASVCDGGGQPRPALWPASRKVFHKTGEVSSPERCLRAAFSFSAP